LDVDSARREESEKSLDRARSAILARVEIQGVWLYTLTTTVLLFLYTESRFFFWLEHVPLLLLFAFLSKRSQKPPTQKKAARAMVQTYYVHKK
jgi:hypothetical protein